MNILQVVSDYMYPYKTLTPIPKGQVEFSKVRFNISPEWEDRDIIVQFHQEEKLVNLSLPNSKVITIPLEFGIGIVTIYLKGYDLNGSSIATTNGVSIPIVQGAFDGGEPPVPPSPDLYAKLFTKVEELNNHPPVPGSNGYWLVWDTDKDEYVESQLALPEATTGGTSDHSKLSNRDAADQHPMSAITGLVDALAGKQPTGDYLTEELDPTVPEWAKQPQKPDYTAQEVGALPATTHIPSTAADVNAEPSGAVAQHNVSDAAHSDIRLIIQGLSERLSAVADSDDATLDQLSEIVAYIKSNKSLIDAITTSKVNVADIVDNLTTNVANKPLSAAQGVALKALIDALTKAIPKPYTLPIASETTLGGVKPVAKTDEMTQSVGVGPDGGLWAKAGGGDSGDNAFELIGTIDWSTEEMAVANAGNVYELSGAKEILIVWTGMVNSTTSNSSVNVNFNDVETTGNMFVGAIQSGKSGTPLSGYSIFKLLPGIGYTYIAAPGAISSVNYAKANPISPYNLYPDTSEKITKISIRNPPTQYYAVGGTTKIYVR